MLTLIQETLRQAENWASLLRAWLPTPRPPSTTGPASANEWVEYEMRLNDVLPNYDDPVICSYVKLLNVNFAVDILRTHPVVVIGGVLVKNSFFSRPEELLRELRGRTAASQSYRG
jgi:hypothetical protein